MATKILTSSQTLSSGTGWLTDAGGNMMAMADSFGTEAFGRALTSELTYAVTFDANANQVGVCLWLRRIAYEATTLTIKLQENVAGVWTDRTTDNFDLAVLVPNLALNCHYFALTTYAVDTTASKWRYSIQANAYTYSLMSTSGGSTPRIAVFTDNSSTAFVSNSDEAIIANNVELEIDSNLILTSTGTFSGIMCQGSSLKMGTTGRSISFYKPLIMSLSGVHFEFGTEANPTSGCNIYVGKNTGTSYGVRFPTGSTTLIGNDVESMTDYFEFYGTRSSDTLFATVMERAESGQKDVVVDETWDMTGKTVMFVGKENDNARDLVEYSISSMSDNTITLSVNLDYALPVGAKMIINASGVSPGVKLYSGSSFNNRYLFSGTSSTTSLVSHVKFNNIGVYSKAGLGSLTYSCAVDNVSVTNVICTNNSGDSLLCAINDYGYTNGSVYSNVIYYNRNNGANNDRLILLNNSSGANVSNVISSGQNYGVMLLTRASECTLSGIYNANNGTMVGQSSLNASDCSFSNCFFNEANGMLCVLLSGCMFSGCTFSGKSTERVQFSLSTSGGVVVDTKFNECDFSVGGPATIQEVGVYGSVKNCVFSDCTFDESLTAYDVVVFSTGFVKPAINFHNFNEAPMNHYVITNSGNIIATGNGLDDTTTHTTGGYAVRFENIGTSKVLEHITTQPTGNIQNKTMTVNVWCKINHADYYSGTHELPRLTINYDNGATAYAQATETTDWQILSVSFIPTTTYGEITMTWSTQTDQTGSASYVYFADVGILYPAGYTLDLGSLDLWANALPVSPYIATSISAKDVWSASSLEEYGDDTMGETLKSAGGGGGATPAEIWAYETRKLTGTKQSLDDLNDISTTQVNTEVTDATSDIKDKVDDIDRTTKDNQALILS